MSTPDKSRIEFATQRERKNRWVTQARSEGKTLVSWIEDTLDAASKPLPPRAQPKNVGRDE